MLPGAFPRWPPFGGHTEKTVGKIPLLTSHSVNESMVKYFRTRLTEIHQSDWSVAVV